MKFYKMDIQIRSMNDSDAQRVLQIYKEGIETGLATFESQVPSWRDWDITHLKTCRLVALIDHQIVGWAALSPVSGRCVYAGVAEVSVYVSSSSRGKKIGTMLLEHLIAMSEKNHFWTLQAGMFPQNTSSIRIHKANGFREIGYREKIGKLNDTWRDTVFYERRSKKY